MKHSVVIIFGREQVRKAYNGIQFTQEEKETNVKRYYFETIEEKSAFIKGVEETIGWTEYCIPEQELLVIKT